MPGEEDCSEPHVRYYRNFVITLTLGVDCETEEEGERMILEAFKGMNHRYSREGLLGEGNPMKFHSIQIVPWKKRRRYFG